jgi:23S rRNA U2552 (ribose-2'-O)-methylase RlmE/FtsJ
VLKNNFTGHRKDVQTLKDYFDLFKHMSWPRKILEIGVDQGGSLKLWNDLFAPDLIVGLDNATREYAHGGYPIETYFYDQKDTDYYNENVFKHSFDMIIDDASHVKELTRNSLHLFWTICNNVYVVEDWNHYEMEDFSDYIILDKLCEELSASYIKYPSLIAFFK